MNRTDRLLVPITYGFSVRYLLPTGVLDRLRDMSTPVIGLGWDDDELSDLLTARGFEVLRLPDPRLSHDYRMYRRRIALIHQRRLDSVTTKIKRRNDVEPNPSVRLIARVREVLDRIALHRPNGIAATEAAESAAVEAGTNAAEFSGFLSANDIDAVLSIAPYHDQEGLLLWAAGRLGIPSATSVISFDNPTTRGRWLARSECVLVWNAFNADEALRSYPDLTSDDVAVIGAPQFDLHRRSDLVMDESKWRAGLDIPENRPIILYGAGPSDLVPGEAGLIEIIDRAITRGRLPGTPILLVRRHPNDPPEPWRELDQRLQNSRLVDPWPTRSAAFRGWPSDEDLVAQMSSLAHSDVHVNVCSSMTLDGAMFDRPQVGPTFVPNANRRIRRRIRSFYEQEHWLPISRSGGVTYAADEDELIAAIRNGLERPELLSTERRAMVESVLTWDDGGSSQRLVDAVAQLKTR